MYHIHDTLHTWHVMYIHWHVHTYRVDGTLPSSRLVLICRIVQSVSTVLVSITIYYFFQQDQYFYNLHVHIYDTGHLLHAISSYLLQIREPKKFSHWGSTCFCFYFWLNQFIDIQSQASYVQLQASRSVQLQASLNVLHNWLCGFVSYMPSTI